MLKDKPQCQSLTGVTMPRKFFLSPFRSQPQELFKAYIVVFFFYQIGHWLAPNLKHSSKARATSKCPKRGGKPPFSQSCSCWPHGACLNDTKCSLALRRKDYNGTMIELACPIGLQISLAHVNKCCILRMQQKQKYWHLKLVFFISSQARPL